MKCAIILAIMAGLLVGISSGGFVTDPINPPSWSSFGVFDDDYEFFDLSVWLREPFPWIELFPQPVPVEIYPVVPPQPWQPVPLVMPEPLPLSKEELFGSLTTISPDKQSLLSSQKNSYFF